MKLRVWNKLKQWYNESKELSQKRMDMLVQKFTVEELIEYRDNYGRNRQIISYFMLILMSVCMLFAFAACVVEEIGLMTTDRTNLYFGYFLGFSIGMLIACPTGSYERKLTKAIEERCIRELELRK